MNYRLTARGALRREEPPLSATAAGAAPAKTASFLDGAKQGWWATRKPPFVPEAAGPEVMRAE